jgi:hypothetical protein
MSREQAQAILEADYLQVYKQFRDWQGKEVLRIATAKTEDEEEWSEDLLESEIQSIAQVQKEHVAQEARDFFKAAAARTGMPDYHLAALITLALACERTGEDIESSAPIARELIALMMEQR